MAVIAPTNAFAGTIYDAFIRSPHLAREPGGIPLWDRIYYYWINFPIYVWYWSAAPTYIQVNDWLQNMIEKADILTRSITGVTDVPFYQGARQNWNAEDYSWGMEFQWLPQEIQQQYAGQYFDNYVSDAVNGAVYEVLSTLGDPIFHPENKIMSTWSIYYTPPTRGGYGDWRLNVWRGFTYSATSRTMLFKQYDIIPFLAYGWPFYYADDFVETELDEELSPTQAGNHFIAPMPPFDLTESRFNAITTNGHGFGEMVVGTLQT